MRKIIFVVSFIILFYLAIIPALASDLLYAQDENGTLTIVDTASNAIITNVFLDKGVWVLANPAGTYVYASSEDGDKIYVLRPGTNTIVDTITLNCPDGMAITSDGNIMYVAMFEDDKVAIIDLRTNTITGYITVGDAPYAIDYAG
jgi:YVTN family beta-propeller protein